MDGIILWIILLSVYFSSDYMYFWVQPRYWKREPHPLSLMFSRFRLYINGRLLAIYKCFSMVGSCLTELHSLFTSKCHSWPIKDIRKKQWANLFFFQTFLVHSWELETKTHRKKHILLPILPFLQHIYCFKYM